ncbi:CUB_2 domain-containing protein [Caenorhabditis elegans]|uniref:CUB_2 domain-containing protein n=1 Tax=Caenorhabditis elegans TaxID=6239 RepID=O44482_CAEEL|nr:CUB_2 domain-containing protein [Caenorhabditis elegans]CCD62063.2 CUB_2 domain-containing protein [Caenorhabditis elegans]|eukprot:NP_501192.2 Uncharacterized protein CELE_F13B6.2 [Caenorhabditis elegans]
MQTLVIFCISILLVLVNSKIHILDSKITEIPVKSGSRLYFLTNGNEADLKQITVKAAGSNINSNAYSYSIPSIDGSLNPLQFSVADTVILTKPEGNQASLSIYHDGISQDLNVFPVFEKSLIQFKSGRNVFFQVDAPNGKIMTITNLKIDHQNDGFLRAYSGSPAQQNGEQANPLPYQFFNSELYDNVNFYQQLDLPIDTFTMDPISTGVSYTVGFGQATTTLQSAGLVMTSGFPYSMKQTDVTYNVNRVGNQDVSLTMNPLFNRYESYDTNIIVKFASGTEQGSSFPSGLNGKMVASSSINSVEISSIGSFAIQYHLNTTTTNLEATTNQPLITTTKSTNVIHSGISCFVLFIFNFI